jgi:hypothetical protein
MRSFARPARWGLVAGLHVFGPGAVEIEAGAPPGLAHQKALAEGDAILRRPAQPDPSGAVESCRHSVSLSIIGRLVFEPR